MTAEQIIIGIVRIGGALPVLRWAFAGSLIAIVVDFSDLFLMGWIRLGGIGDYQAFDKWLDLTYLVAFLWVVWKHWDRSVKLVAVGLLAFRMLGFVAFELSGARWILLAFPNVFEFWFVGISAQRHWWSDYDFTTTRITLWLTICTVLKMAQEWVLHGGRYLDRYRAVDLAADWWNAILSVI